MCLYWINMCLILDYDPGGAWRGLSGGASLYPGLEGQSDKEQRHQLVKGPMDLLNS